MLTRLCRRLQCELLGFWRSSVFGLELGRKKGSELLGFWRSSGFLAFEEVDGVGYIGDIDPQSQPVGSLHERRPIPRGRQTTAHQMINSLRHPHTRLTAEFFQSPERVVLEFHSSHHEPILTRTRVKPHTPEQERPRQWRTFGAASMLPADEVGQITDLSWQSLSNRSGTRLGAY